MDEMTRREAVGVAALAGAAALASMSGASAQAADAPSKLELNPILDKEQEKTERDLLESLGMTPDEIECWILTGSAAGKFFQLPKIHPMDDEEVAHAIHVVQGKLLGRPVYRKYVEFYRKQGKM